MMIYIYMFVASQVLLSLLKLELYKKYRENSVEFSPESSKKKTKSEISIYRYSNCLNLLDRIDGIVTHSLLQPMVACMHCS